MSPRRGASRFPGDGVRRGQTESSCAPTSAEVAQSCFERKICPTVCTEPKCKSAAGGGRPRRLASLPERYPGKPGGQGSAEFPQVRLLGGQRPHGGPEESRRCILLSGIGCRESSSSPISSQRQGCW